MFWHLHAARRLGPRWLAAVLPARPRSPLVPAACPRLRRLALFCALGAASSGCGRQQRGTPPLILGNWHIEAPAAAPRRAELEQMLRRTIASEPSLKWARGQAKLSQASLHVSFVRRETDQRHIGPEFGAAAPYACIVRLRLPAGAAPRALGPRPQRLVATAPMADLAATTTEHALAFAWSQVARKRALLLADKEGWLAAVCAHTEAGSWPSAPWDALATTDYLAQAMSYLAEAHVLQSVPALLAVLAKTGEPGLEAPAKLLAQRAVGALALLGDERAVLPLIDFSQRKSALQVAQVATAVGLIGGRVAEGWLTTLASGHNDEHVRSAAQLALGELPRRSAQAGTSRRPKDANPMQPNSDHSH